MKEEKNPAQGQGSYKLTKNNFTLTTDKSAKMSLEDLLVNDQFEDQAARIKSIKFHIGCGDYFGALATILDLLAQDKRDLKKRRQQILENLRDDLMYLQRTHKIIKK